jgi:hypothetical protein
MAISETMLFGSIAVASLIGVYIGLALYKRFVGGQVTQARQYETEKIDKLLYDPDRITNKDVIRDLRDNQDKGFDKLASKLDKVISLLSVPKPVTITKPRPIATSLQARKTIQDLKPKIEQQIQDNAEQQILDEIDRLGGQAQAGDIKFVGSRMTKHRKLNKLVEKGSLKKTGVFYHIIKPLEVHSDKGNDKNNDIVGIPW